MAGPPLKIFEKIDPKLPKLVQDTIHWLLVMEPCPGNLNFSWPWLWMHRKERRKG